MKRTAVLFDLDGTLVDSVPDLAAAANRLLAESDGSRSARPRSPRWSATASPSWSSAPPPGRPAMRRWHPRSPASPRSHEADATARTRPYPGVPEGLAALARAGAALAVCTNKSERATHAVLDGLGLASFFAAVLGGDSLPTHKPDPAPLVAALNRLGVAPAQAAMVGDHRNDVLAAEGAGTAAIFARYGYGLAGLGALRPDAMIDRVADALLAGRDARPEITASVRCPEIRPTTKTGGREHHLGGSSS